jgi:hypothetical protein
MFKLFCHEAFIYQRKLSLYQIINNHTLLDLSGNYP